MLSNALFFNFFGIVRPFWEGQMPAKRIAMRKIRDVLRLRLEARLSIRQIKASTKVSVGAIQKLLSQAELLGLSWPLAPDLDDAQLAQMFYPGADTTASRRYQVPDWPAVHQELKRKGMTKQLLWEEYTEQYPNRCYSYSQYCDRYSRWRKQQKRSMRQLHKAGEKGFIDYCGPTVGWRQLFLLLETIKSAVSTASVRGL